jgi:hypothetical protein
VFASGAGLTNVVDFFQSFVATPFHADPLTWRFNGIAGPGSTYNGTSIEGREFQLQIFLNTSLIGFKDEGLSEINFEGPFRGQVHISGVGTVPVDLFSHVQNFPVQGEVSHVIFFFYDHRIQAGFSPPIPSDPHHLGAIPETPITSTEPDVPEFFGPNDLHVIGNLNSFSATTGPVVTELPGDGRTPSAPGVVSGILNDEAMAAVFIRGVDNRIYVNALVADFSDFTTWFEVPPGGRSTTSEPAAVIYGNTLELFVRGPDNAIYENHFVGSPRELDNPDRWSGWVEVEGHGLTLSGPAAVVDNNGRLKLFVRGLNDGIWENDFIGGSFRGWFELPGGGLTLESPSAVMHRGVLKLFVRGLNDGIWENDFIDGSFTGWFELPGGGLTLESPSALVHQGILKLFVTGLDDGVWENDFDGTTFTGWFEVSRGGLTSSAPAAVEAFFRRATPPPDARPRTGYPTVFLRGEDGRVFQGFF